MCRSQQGAAATFETRGFVAEMPAAAAAIGLELLCVRWGFFCLFFSPHVSL